jgi:hypothetical protein
VGLKSVKIGERAALELTCDGIAHRSERPRAWFDCGSDFGNLSLALAAGWKERRNAKGIWLCPCCAHKNEQGGGAPTPTTRPSANAALRRRGGRPKIATTP